MNTPLEISKLVVNLEEASKELTNAQKAFKKAEERLEAAAISHETAMIAFGEMASGIRTGNKVPKIVP
jgi:predicted  nucleic acid-binding Zn-ribbon protein